MKINRKYVIAASMVMVAFFLLGTVGIAAPKNPNKLPKPDYDSGWINGYVFGDEYEFALTHNLGTRDLFVYFYFRMEDPSIPSSDYTQTHNIRSSDVYWRAYDYNQIEIYFPHGDYAWQEIRVLIWAVHD